MPHHKLVKGRIEQSQISYIIRFVAIGEEDLRESKAIVESGAFIQFRVPQNLSTTEGIGNNSFCSDYDGNAIWRTI